MKTIDSFKKSVHKRIENAELGMSAALIGFAFWQAWQMLVMHAGVLVPITSTMSGPFIGTSTIFIATTIIIPVGILVKMKAHESFRTDCLFVCICSFSGTILIALTSLFTEYAIAIFIIGVLLYSASNALILLLWGKFWSTLGVAWVARSLSWSYVLAFGLFFIIGLLPWMIKVIAVALLLPASIICLRSGEKCEKRLQPTIMPIERPKAILKMCVFIVVISFAFGYMQSGFAILHAATYSKIVYQGMAIAAFGVGLLVLLLYQSQKPEIVLIYNMIIPFASLGLLLFLSDIKGLEYLEFGLFMVGVYCLDILIMLVATDISFRIGKSVYLYFGTGFFLARGSALVARLTSMHFLDTGFLSKTSFDNGVLTLLFCLITVGMLIFSKSELITLYRLGEKEPTSEPLTPTPTISDACERIAVDYSLTPRETEIFGMLARGRTIPYICEELVIAENTGKRHVSNIYRKLCIYDRQGLHDIVDRYLGDVV